MALQSRKEHETTVVITLVLPSRIWKNLRRTPGPVVSVMYAHAARRITMQVDGGDTTLIKE